MRPEQTCPGHIIVKTLNTGNKEKIPKAQQRRVKSYLWERLPKLQYISQQKPLKPEESGTVNSKH